MDLKLDQVIRYKGTDYKIIGVEYVSGKSARIMIAINGKVTIISCNEINK